MFLTRIEFLLLSRVVGRLKLLPADVARRQKRVVSKQHNTFRVHVLPLPSSKEGQHRLFLRCLSARVSQIAVESESNLLSVFARLRCWMEVLHVTTFSKRM